jgi:hypothetical protein
MMTASNGVTKMQISLNLRALTNDALSGVTRGLLRNEEHRDKKKRALARPQAVACIAEMRRRGLALGEDYVEAAVQAISLNPKRRG